MPYLYPDAQASVLERIGKNTNSPVRGSIRKNMGGNGQTVCLTSLFHQAYFSKSRPHSPLLFPFISVMRPFLKSLESSQVNAVLKVLPTGCLVSDKVVRVRTRERTAYT